MTEILQPGEHLAGQSAHYLPAEPQNVLWGRLPCRRDTPVLRVTPGESVTVDTLSHEGLLEDQGRDPYAISLVSESNRSMSSVTPSPWLPVTPRAMPGLTALM